MAELIQAIREELEVFNHKRFQNREGSRAFHLAEEKLFLLPLPAAPFELAVWKVATVQYNYHIIVERPEAENGDQRVEGLLGGAVYGVGRQKTMRRGI